MAITRKFIDWSCPALPAVVDFLVQQYLQEGRLDLDNVVVVLPGGRAGRRLMEMLADRAQAESWVLFPPQIRTAGTVPELLYESKRPFASDLVQQLAWVHALQQLGPDLRGQLVAELPDHTEFLNWMELARLVWRQHRELAADGLDFAHVASQKPEAGGFQEHDRWQILSAAQQGYLALLDDLGLWDLQTARLFAIEHRLCATDSHIILVAMADMNRVLRLMFDQVANHVTVLVHAPEAWSDRFDQYGCLVPASWQDVVIPVETRQILVRENPLDQAEAAVDCLAAFNGQYRADQIVVGVLDERLVPQIQRSLRQAEVPSRWVVGIRLAETAPYRLLTAIGQFVEQQTFASLASLVRHPDVERWLELQGIRGDYLTQLDEYRGQHLQPRIGTWLGNPERRELLVQVASVVAGLTRPFCQPIDKPLLTDWGTEIVRLLQEIYKERDFDRNDPQESQTLEALHCIRNVLAQQQQVPTPLLPQLTARQAIGQLLDQLSKQELSASPDDQALELLGWLELPLDTAPALIVTSFNEGLVPKSVNSDLFLPNRLRQQLGLVDNSRRYARDAYALSVLVASREELRLVVGRRSMDNDPLVPSRLIFATDSATMARRALQVFDPHESEASKLEVKLANPTQDDRSLIVVQSPTPLEEPLDSVRVTAFRDYLACPYRFYLRHVLGLTLLDDNVPELDARHFGTLAHEVLQQFSQSDVKQSADAQEIQKFIMGTLSRQVDEQFGRERYPAVEVQLAQLRSRLSQFAAWQAEWVAQGWQIVYAETAGGESPAELTLADGQTMALRGRIDRIDRHQQSGQWAIFDYKTSDSPRKPELVHQSSGRWVDLQLPLYRHIARSLQLEGELRLGYIVLPKDVTQVGAMFADWGPEDLAEADAEAIRVATAIQGGIFWPPALPAPKMLTDYATICQDHAFRPNFEDPERAIMEGF